MRVISKSEVANHLALETLSKISSYKIKVSELEKKYKCEFKQFEKKVKKSKTEVFEEWDDYLDWKAYVNILNDLQSKVKDLKHGNFKVA